MNLTNLIVYLIVLSLMTVGMTSPVQARLLPRAKGGTPQAINKTVNTNTKGVTAGVKFRSDRRAIFVNFSNLSVASSVNYQLVYQARGLSQGAQGSVSPGSPEPVQRELLFGTCSGPVCRYDSSITNAKLTVTTKLKSGKTVVKSYKIKI